MLHDMKHSKVGLVGNPNCGKTTLFNVLSRSQQRVGNWPGVTVERQSGFYTHGKESVEVIDLPGIYSLIAMTKTESIDAEIACDTILSNQVDVIVNVIDAAHLERHLYLTTQLLEMSVPVVIALNMIDVVKQNGLKIDIQKLEQMLGCPVVCIQANKNIGMEELKDTIAQVIKNKTTQKAKKILTLPPVVEESIKNIIPYLDNFPVSQQRCVALRLLEGDQTIHAKVGTEINDLLKSLQQKIENEFKEEADIILADARYSFAHEVSQRTVQESGKKSVNWTERLDRIILNRVLGLPIFLGVMYCMFLFAIHIGGAFQDFFDISTQTIFVEGLAHGFTTLQFPPWFTAIVVAGVGKGINTTLTFVPVIAAMFFFLSFLEDSGYMARAAFVMDRVMRALRLPGKSFVPLIIGFGCNVPAVMAARTLENKQDRILTVLMTPFMSCGARLAIYAVFTTAFFPVGGQNIVFALYMIGILVAVFTAWLLRKTWLGGESTPLVLELPRYHVPRFSVMCMHTWSRLKKFIYKAGKYIIPICVIIGGLNAITVDGGLNLGEGSVDSLLSLIGKQLTPLFAPMGITSDNWPATVGLLTGTVAKEVVVGTLNALYTQIAHLSSMTSSFDFWSGMKAAFSSIPENIRALPHVVGNPISATANVAPITTGVYGVMYEKFDGQVGAFAYLLFVLLYVPCISTIIMMAKELSRGWALFSVFWSTALAYTVAVMFYQAATFLNHPITSTCWIVGLPLFLMSIIFFGNIVPRFCHPERESCHPERQRRISRLTLRSFADAQDDKFMRN